MDSILAIKQPQEQLAAFETHIAPLLSAENAPALISVGQAIVAEHGPSVVIARNLLDALSSAVSKTSSTTQITVTEGLLQAIQPRLVSFEEQVTTLRERLATLFKDQEDWSRAALCLQGIPLESGNRAVPLDQKIKTYVHICELFLEDGDAGRAELALNKAAMLVDPSFASSTSPDELGLRFRVCQARVLDHKRKFLEAAQRFYRLSTLVYDPQEQIQSLVLSIQCAILAQAGPRRLRLLALLFKDERAPSLTVYPMLEKMFKERIVDKAEAAQFANQLQPHHNAVGAGGMTVVEHAIIEHNLLSASKIYRNISIIELGQLLGVTPQKAEDVACGMIQSERMYGVIDQVAGVIEFSGSSATSAVERWNAHIEWACLAVDEIVRSF